MDPYDPDSPLARRSILAYSSALVGVLALLGVLCFHFPELLTSRDFRQAYSETFARHALLVGLVAAFVMGTIAILRGRDRRVALLGVGSATLAVLLGGVTVRFGAIEQTPFSLGLDWFVISLFFSALVFIPVERMLGRHRQLTLRAEWRTDIAYYFVSHAIHHSSRHMDWLAGSRIHVIEVILTRSFVLLPLIALGFAPAAVNAYVILVGLQAVLAHANLGLRFGWLEYVLVLPRYHHWHHARDRDYVDVNYAIHLPLVDLLMGTFKLPRDNAFPGEYGILKPETVPPDIVRQHLAPFLGRW